MDAALIVDASHLACPLPILRLAVAVREAAPGTVVRLWATDPGVRADVPAWCQATGHALLAQGEDGPRLWVDVQKAPAPAGRLLQVSPKPC